MSENRLFYKFLDEEYCEWIPAQHSIITLRMPLWSFLYGVDKGEPAKLSSVDKLLEYIEYHKDPSLEVEMVIGDYIIIRGNKTGYAAYERRAMLIIASPEELGMQDLCPDADTVFADALFPSISYKLP